MFKIKFYAPNNIIRHIREKHGQEVLKHIRSLKDDRNHLMKIETNISFIKAFKTEQLIATFAKINCLIDEQG